MNAATSIRAFVAVSLGKAVREQIALKQAQLAQTWALPHVRWIPAEQMHLTLRFLGNVETAQLPTLEAALREALQGVSPFRLAARGMGCFPSCQRPNIIWVGLEGGLIALRDVQTRVEHASASFSAHLEERAYHPHLTIGRVKVAGPTGRALGERIRTESKIAFGEWEVDRVELMRSQLSPKGSVYTTLAELVLAAR